MHTTEKDRIDRLYRQLTRNGIKPDSILGGDYTGVAIHSDSTVILGNQSACEIFGYSADELKGINAWTLFAPESAPQLLDHISRGSESPYEVIARHKDGSKFRVTLKGQNFTIEGEELRAVLIKKHKHNQAPCSTCPDTLPQPVLAKGH